MAVVKAICGECKKSLVLLSQETLNKIEMSSPEFCVIKDIEIESIIEGAAITAKMFECGYCGKWHTVQTDNKITKSLLAKAKKPVLQMGALRKKGTRPRKKFSDALAKTYQEQSDKLDLERKALSVACEGKMFKRLDTGEEFKLELSVYDEQDITGDDDV